MTEVDKDFDLLAGHDLGESRVITYKDEEDPDKMNVLVWHKLETVGFQPSAREVRFVLTVLPCYTALIYLGLCLTFLRGILRSQMACQCWCLVALRLDR